MHLTQNHRNKPGVWCLVDESGMVVRELGASSDGTLRSFSHRDTGYVSGVRSLVASANISQALTAAAVTDDLMVPWESDAIAFLNTETSDKRTIDSVAGFRSFPIPLMAMFQTSWGHDGAYVVGRMDDGGVSGDNVPAKGYIDTALPMGLQAARMVETGSMDRVSIDPSGGTVEMEVTEQDEDGWVTDWIDHYLDVEIGGLTLVNISAFAESKMRLSDTAPVATEDETEDDSIAASAASSVDPPLEFFQDPQLSGRTRLTIDDPDDNGHRRIYGHLAPWEECHIGIQGQCVMAPSSPSGYAWFTLGSVKCDEGCVIPIGSITYRGAHAEKHLAARAATAHYDNTCMQAADIAIGEDEFGIWYSGAVRTTMTDEDVRELRASRLSGDWRKVNGDFELVAAHGVNTGGYPVYEEAIAADGSVQTIIASLDADDVKPVTTTEDRALRLALAPLFAERVDALRARMARNSG